MATTNSTTNRVNRVPTEVLHHLVHDWQPLATPLYGDINIVRRQVLQQVIASINFSLLGIVIFAWVHWRTNVLDDINVIAKMLILGIVLGIGLSLGLLAALPGREEFLKARSKLMCLLEPDIKDERSGDNFKRAHILEMARLHDPSRITMMLLNSLKERAGFEQSQRQQP